MFWGLIFALLIWGVYALVFWSKSGNRWARNERQSGTDQRDVFRFWWQKIDSDNQNLPKDASAFTRAFASKALFSKVKGFYSILALLQTIHIMCLSWLRNSAWILTS